jgi:phosphoribosylformylglycinamidine synthase
MRATLTFVAAEIAAICAGGASDVTAVHDVSGGGLATALAEMAASTGRGLRASIGEHAELFTEFPGRFVMATSDVAAFSARAASAGVAVEQLGVVSGSRIELGAFVSLDVAEVASRRDGALERQMDAALAN